MEQSEFLRWLINQGVEVKNATNHIKLYYKGRQSTMPRHPSKGLPIGTIKAIQKQLNIN